LRALAAVVPFVAIAFLTAPLVRAQWATFQDQTATRLVATAGLGSADPQEKDYAFADFDQDGDIDLVCVRKQPASTSGHFPNVLFMNEGGVLRDRTALYASASLVPASSGMLDATNDRDVLAIDVNGDGWLDLVTCTTLTSSMPQYIRVPRVYINLGDDVVGNWQGFLYDDPLRIDDASWGGNHRFCAVAAGDIDNDGDLDLYFGDYDRGTGDPNDRLLRNNGAGYFTDVTATQLPSPLNVSNFVTSAQMADFNLDGRIDYARNNVASVDITYNNGASGPGFFSTRQNVYSGAAYHFNLGDLNNDGLPDIIVSDDGQDRYVLNLGPSGGVATWGPTQSFSYVGGGSDDGFGSTSRIADLNNDGWNDVLITDFDVDVTGCNRRTHIFRNLGNAPNVTLQEQMVGGAVCGIPTGMLSGTYDIAIFDINGDGWKDMVIGRCNGTQVWMNMPPTGLAFSYPNGLPTFVDPGVSHSMVVQVTGVGAAVPAAASGFVYWSVDNAPWQQAPMLDLGPGLYLAELPAVSCTAGIRYSVSVDSQLHVTYSDPPTAPAASYTAVAAADMQVIYESGFESPVLGWTVTNTALTGGAWEIATPIPTNVGAQFAAPPFDAENIATATKCWVTQNGLAGGLANDADVDGGPTDLITPPLNFGGTDGFISYRRWFFSSTTEDTLLVHVSNDGVNWVQVESVSSTGNNQWLQRQFRVGDFVAPSNQVRVRFRTSDNPNNSTVEAAIDVFRAEAFRCSPCQEMIPLATNGNALISVCGGALPVPGTWATLQLVSLPASSAAYVVFDLPLLPTPWLGGTLLSPAPVLFGEVLADAFGTWEASLPLGGLAPPGIALHAQAVYLSAPHPSGVGQTNVVKLQW
jgi:hypothetical protein